MIEVNGHKREAYLSREPVHEVQKQDGVRAPRYSHPYTLTGVEELPCPYIV